MRLKTKLFFVYLAILITVVVVLLLTVPWALNDPIVFLTILIATLLLACFVYDIRGNPSLRIRDFQR